MFQYFLDYSQFNFIIPVQMTVIVQLSALKFSASNGSLVKFKLSNKIGQGVSLTTFTNMGYLPK